MEGEGEREGSGAWCVKGGGQEGLMDLRWRDDGLRRVGGGVERPVLVRD